MARVSLLDRSDISKEILEKSWDNSVFVDCPEISSEWKSIGKKFSAGYSNNNLDDQDFLTERIESIEFCLQEVQQFQIKFSDFLFGQDQIDFIETLKNSLRAEILINQLYHRAFSDSRMRVNSIERVDAIYEWYLFIHQRVIDFIGGKTFSKEYIYKLEKDFFILSNENLFESSLNYLEVKSKDKLYSKIESIKTLISGLKIFHDVLKRSISSKNTDEVNTTQNEKNKAALKLIESWKSQKLSDADKKRKKEDFEYLVNIVDSNRIPGQGVFSSQ